MPSESELRAACIVSCDIVSHGAATEARQYASIQAINDLVRGVIQAHGPERVIWASGGDGGHVALLGETLLSSALRLAADLADWSTHASVPLRTTLHYGSVTILEGADGRSQLVGRTINLCGSLVNFGIPAAVVVSAEFRQFLQRHQQQALDLSDYELCLEQTVYLKHFEVHNLSLLKLPGRVQPTWAMVRSDDRHLDDASAKSRWWQMIYHIKRLLQVNSADPHAKRTLDTLNPIKLAADHDKYPLFVSMSRESIKALILESQLVEREDGDIICEKGAAGDAMFVVLKGEVGVVTGRSSAEEGPKDIRFTEGTVVGELALGLQRRRTATLQAIGTTALLAITYPAYKRLLTHKRVQDALDRLIKVRTLEHIYNNTAYLAEPAPQGDRPSKPIIINAQNDDRPWTTLEDGTELITYDPVDAYDISPAIRAELSAQGVYVLAGGQLVEDSESPGARKVLLGDNFDLAFVNLPPEIVHVSHAFRIDPKGPGGRISILRIGREALTAFTGSQMLSGLGARLGTRLGQQMLFDVFISYAFDDAIRVQGWRDEFKKAGLSVYMNEQGNPMERFEREIEIALSESRVFMPVVSRASSQSPWVTQEVSHRKRIFHEEPNTLPMIVQGGVTPESMRGIACILVGSAPEQESAAIKKAIDTILSVRAGTLPPPLSRRPPTCG